MFLVCLLVLVGVATAQDVPPPQNLVTCMDDVDCNPSGNQCCWSYSGIWKQWTSYCQAPGQFCYRPSTKPPPPLPNNPPKDAILSCTDDSGCAMGKECCFGYSLLGRLWFSYCQYPGRTCFVPTTIPPPHPW